VIATGHKHPHETVRVIGSHGNRACTDVTQEEDWCSATAKSQDVGEVDIVMNNAGYFPNRPTWRQTMAANLDLHFLSARYFLPAMREKAISLCR
jgi:NAD(P)-dependent dehydrogenase (short-subunit alcohol dehydrogenase family)